MSSSLSWLYFRSSIWMAGAIAAVCAAGLAHAGPPKESVLYNFAGGAADGSTPYAGVILDKDGALYGTTVYGGTLNFGTVYRLTLQGQRWSKTILHNFSSAPDGNSPFAGVVFGNDGALYGTTVTGGNPGTPGYGTVYRLSPPANGEPRSCMTDPDTKASCREFRNGGAFTARDQTTQGNEGDARHDRELGQHKHAIFIEWQN